VELALLQNLTLLMGHPIFTLAILLFTLLASETSGGEQREEQNREGEDWMAQQQRQVLQQREFDADEPESQAREIHDGCRIGRGRLLLWLSERREQRQQHDVGREQ